MNKMLFITLLLLIKTSTIYGQSIIAVGEAERKSQGIAVQSPIYLGKITNQQKKIIEQFKTVIEHDLSYYKKYFTLKGNFTVSNFDFKDPNYGELLRKDVAYFLQLEASCLKKTLSCKISISLHSTALKTEILSTGIDIFQNSVRSNGHIITDKIVKKITNKNKTIFNSKIVFVSDRHSTSKQVIKELYIMDFDGFNKRRLTYHNGIVIAPAISSNKKLILYSLIKEDRNVKSRNINLYLYNLESKNSKLISSRKGMNSGAVFLPDMENIALTISQSGNAEIYIMNLKTKRLTRLTRHYSSDVDPSISADGKTMAFLSGRPGKATVYTMKTKGTEANVKRISYVGKFNATPRFSPDGSEIAFSSWLDNRFDIFKINTPGTQLVRLTKNFGSNEDPSYSPDGEFIVFSSLRVLNKKRTGQHIYVMDRDGEIIGAITNHFGNCITPRWSH